jgi:hypothetical protein
MMAFRSSASHCWDDEEGGESLERLRRARWAPSSAFLLIAVSQALLPWKTWLKWARFRAG